MHNSPGRSASSESLAGILRHARQSDTIAARSRSIIVPEKVG
jgi:hypothetical protein